MNTLDARGVLAQAIRQAGLKPQKSGKAIAFRCPRHNDSHASAWLGDHQWGCAACGFTEHFDTLADALGITLPSNSQGRGLSMAEYAEAKGLSLDFLSRAGVHEVMGRYGDAIVAIPYRDGNGAVIRTKYRTRKGTFWGKDGEGAPLYGQDILATSSESTTILIVEGESDCHAAWQRGVIAVGLPGASQWRSEYAALIGKRPVVVWQEPDEGGATLVAAVARDLPKAKVLREVTIDSTPMKDLCDLHQAVFQHGLEWETTWQSVLRTATPIGAEAPAVAFDVVGGDTLLNLLDEKEAPIDAVPTMLDGWNELCHGGGGGVGLARGWFVTIGANTGTGKSLIGLNLAAHAIQHGEVPTFISLEMGRSELATRLLSIISQESVATLEQGPTFSREAFLRASAVMEQVRRDTGGFVLVNRAPISKLSDVVACIKHHVESYNSRFFVVDYLQLVWTADGHSPQERMELVAHKLRELTHEHRIVLVGLSQFNRQTSAARQERPIAQGLMGGSALENDSHQVLLFDHSRFERAGNIADTWLIVDKNRHGPVRDIPVRWDFRTLKLLPRVLTMHETDTPKKRHA